MQSHPNWKEYLISSWFYVVRDLNDFKNLSGETKDDLKTHSKGMCYYQESLFLSFYELLSIVRLYIKHWLGHVQELSPGKAISIVAIVVDPNGYLHYIHF